VRWCQAANTLCRKGRTTKGEEEEQASNKPCIHVWWALELVVVPDQVLFHLKPAQSVSAVHISLLFVPLPFSSHTADRVQTSLFLSLSDVYMLQAGVWCMMRLQGTWVAWRPHMSSLMPWCFGTQQNTILTHKSDTNLEILGIPNSHKSCSLGCFFTPPEKLGLKYLLFDHQPRFNPVSRYLISLLWGKSNLPYLGFLLP
jgi:hypothetical protein